MKTDPDAWLLAANQHWNIGETEKALLILDSAITYLPTDSVLTKKRYDFDRIIKINLHRELYDKANVFFNSKQYPEALEVLNELIQKEPGLTELYLVRAYCQFYTENYYACISDIDIAIEKGTVNYSLVNLRGESYRLLGQSELACRDFKAAMDKGNVDAASNYKKFCVNLE